MFFVKINYFYKTSLRIKSIQLNNSKRFMNNYYQLLLTVNNWKMTVNQRVSGSSPEGGAGSPQSDLVVGFFMPETSVISPS